MNLLYRPDYLPEVQKKSAKPEMYEIGDEATEVANSISGAASLILEDKKFGVEHD